MWAKHRSKSGFVFSFSILISFFFATLAAGASQKIKCPVQSIYQLGDSIADTGNTKRILGLNATVSRPPYGITFPGFPTGRWSDGLLIIDYVAMDVGLPLLNPYLARFASFRNGVNFAVGGSTTLNLTFFDERGIRVFRLPSLRVQLDWFRRYLTSICSSPTGFDSKTLFKPCCGFEGRFDPFGTRVCGNRGLPLCRNRNRYIHWDGMHLTQEAYRRISEILIENLEIDCS